MRSPPVQPVSHLSEAQFAVKVFVHLFDHVLEAQVSLRSSQFLHHQLQLHEVDEAVSTSVIPKENEGFQTSLWTFAAVSHS